MVQYTPLIVHSSHCCAYVPYTDQPVQAGFESTTLSVTEGQSLVQVCAVIFNPTAIGTRTFTASVVASGGSAQGEF